MKRKNEALCEFYLGRPNKVPQQRSGLNNGNVLSHSSEGWKSNIQNPVSPDASLCGLQTRLSRCVLRWPFLCVYTSLVFSSTSQKDTSPLGLGPHP